MILTLIILTFALSTLALQLAIHIKKQKQIVLPQIVLPLDDRLLLLLGYVFVLPSYSMDNRSSNAGINLP